MQHIMTPFSSPSVPFAYWEKCFTNEELNWLKEKAMNADQRAQVGGVNSEEDLSKIRRSQVSWLNKTSESSWVFEKLSHVVSSLNAQFYRFDITGFSESLQLTNYNSAENGMYGWHQDFNAKVSRKLSLILQLTDPSEYEGGNLQIFTSKDPLTISKQKGLITIFPSYTLHQVTPVTSGSRQTLVAWICGPDFK